MVMLLDFVHQTTRILDEKIVENIHKYREALIWGTGESGEWVREYLEAKKITPACYIDNYKPRQGTEKNGIRILSFEDAILEYKDACICIGSLWADEIISQIREYNQEILERTIDFRGAMVWEIKEKIFQSDEIEHIKANMDRYDDLEKKLCDVESQKVLKGLLNYRMTRDNSYLRDIECAGEEYVDNAVVPSALFCNDDAEIIDGGAFDGDTIDLLLKYFDSDRITIHCYEPSKDNAKRIREKEKKLTDVDYS